MVFKNRFEDGMPSINVKEADIPKTTFHTRYGHYEFTMMLFYLTSAPAALMDLMKWVCRTFLNRFVIVFINDILIYSINVGDHTGHLWEVLEVLRREKFT